MYYAPGAQYLICQYSTKSYITIKVLAIIAKNCGCCVMLLLICNWSKFVGLFASLMPIQN